METLVVGAADIPKICGSGNSSKGANYTKISVPPEILGGVSGYSNRIEFLRRLGDWLSADGVIVVTPRIRGFSPVKKDFWISQFLKLKWALGGDWEEGDTLTAAGSFHFYPTERAFLDEVMRAGLVAKKLSPGVWQLSHPA